MLLEREEGSVNGNDLIVLFLMINVGFTVTDISLHRRRNRHNQVAMDAHLDLCDQLRRVRDELSARDPDAVEPLAASFRELDRAESRLRAVLDRPRWRQLLDF